MGDLYLHKTLNDQVRFSTWTDPRMDGWMWQYLLVFFSFIWSWDLLLLPCKEGRDQKVGWFKCPCRCSCSASALHNQSLCASEEGNGTQYTEKKSSPAGTGEWVLTCCVLAWQGSSVHLCHVSFFSTVPIKAGQRPLSAGGTALLQLVVAVLLLWKLWAFLSPFDLSLCFAYGELAHQWSPVYVS